jgi:hypothetical protein
MLISDRRNPLELSIINLPVGCAVCVEHSAAGVHVRKCWWTHIEPDKTLTSDMVRFVCITRGYQRGYL